MWVSQDLEFESWLCAMQHSAESHLYLRVSLRIRNHTQILFYPLIRDPNGNVEAKTRGQTIS
jgi:hypothetical protein